MEPSRAKRRPRPPHAAPGTEPGRVHSPAVREEAPADVPGPVTARRGAGHALRLDGLPGELGAIEVPVLLPLGRQGAPGRTSVGGVLAGDVTLAIAPGHGAPGGQRGKLGCLATLRLVAPQQGQVNLTRETNQHPLYCSRRKEKEKSRKGTT